MPKWVFNYTKGALTLEDKKNLAQGMSNIYTTFGLPSFLAHVHFFELEANNIWSGGEPSHSFTTITIYHAAANIRNKTEGENFLKALDDVVRPVLKPKGISWESNIYETPRDNWRVQGMAPPNFGSDMMNRWIRDNEFTKEDEEQILHQQGYFVCQFMLIQMNREY